jgi:DNA-binding winged helix-turn-helix (wHTH) protein/tetratricopeptide (TPR) repeat protein
MKERYVVFDSFVYDTLRKQLVHRGTQVALTPKALEVLELFLERPDELLTKDLLLETVWPGESVQEGNLAQQVYLLRKVFADFGTHDLIITVPRRGYRFAGEVTRTAAQQLPIAPSADSRSVPFGGPRALRVLVAAGFVAALGLGASFGYRSLHASNPSAVSMLPPRAQSEYRLARFYFDQPPFKELPLALAAFQNVTRLAPQSPLGYAGVADAELRMAGLDDSRNDVKKHSEAGREYALQALRLAPGSPQAHISYGNWLDWYGHSPLAAAREFETAIALDPNDASAHMWLGALELYNGNFTRSISELREARRLDPTSFVISRSLGMAYYYSRHYAEAIPQLQETLTLYPASSLSRLHMAMALEESGHPERALAILKRLSTKDFNRVELRTWIAYCLAKEGRRAEAIAEVDRIALSPERRFVAPSSLAAVYVAAGRPREAAALLADAKMTVLTMWSPPESAALVPRYDPRIALLYEEGHLKDLR